MIRRHAILLSRFALLFCAWSGTASAAKPAKPPEEKVVLEEEQEDDEAEEAKEGGVVLDEEPEAEPAEKEPGPTETEEAKSTKHSPSVWLQLGLVQDVTFVSGTEVCSPQSQIDGKFTCTRASGSQYHGTPLPGSAGDASGVALGPTRVALAADLPLGGSFGAGLRVGYAFLGQGPTPDGGKKYLPWLVEARGHYWFTGKAFSSEQVGAFFLLSGGIAQVDGKKSVTVREDLSVPPPVGQLDNPPIQRLDAWHKSGVGFAGAGAGVFLPFGERFGVLADLRAIVLFPTPGFGLSAGISMALGL